MFAGGFAPRGWAFCDWQMLSIAQNSILFSLIGTSYGSDGSRTFALPDLRGRAPIHVGQGENLRNIRLGEKGGSELSELIKIKISEKVTSEFSEIYTVRSDKSNLQTRGPYVGINYIIAIDGK